MTDKVKIFFVLMKLISYSPFIISSLKSWMAKGYCYKIIGKVTKIKIIDDYDAYFDSKFEDGGVKAINYDGAILCLFIVNKIKLECCVDKVFFKNGDTIECMMMNHTKNKDRAVLYAIRKPETREQWINFYMRKGSRALLKDLFLNFFKLSRFLLPYTISVILVIQMVMYFFNDLYFQFKNEVLIFFIFFVILHNILLGIMLVLHVPHARDNNSALRTLGYDQPNKIALKKSHGYYHI